MHSNEEKVYGCMENVTVWRELWLCKVCCFVKNVWRMCGETNRENIDVTMYGYVEESYLHVKRDMQYM